MAGRNSGEAGWDGDGLLQHQEVHPGDPVKRINWRASARRTQESDDFLVNEYIAEVGAEVLIVVDAGRVSGVRQRPKPPRGVLGQGGHLDRGEAAARPEPRRTPYHRGEPPQDRFRIPGGGSSTRSRSHFLQLEPGESDIEWWVERSLHMFFPTYPR